MCAHYLPPEENLAIFDPSVFKKPTDALTIGEADKRYLRYPNAQGTENFIDINVYGESNFQDKVIITDNTPSGSSTDILELKQSQNANTMKFLLNPQGGQYNWLVQNDDNVIISGNSNTASNPLTMAVWSGTTSGVRLEKDRMTMGVGGGTSVPTNRMVIDASNITFDASNNNSIVFNRAINVSEVKTLSGDLALNPVGDIATLGNTIKMGGGEIHNCPLVHSQNNGILTLEGLGAGSVALKTNGLDRVIVNSAGVIDVSANTIQSVSNINSRTNQNMILDAKGSSNSLILRADASNAMTITGGGAINVEFPLSMTSAIQGRRSINTSALNFNEAGGTYNSNVLSQFYNTVGIMVYNNNVNNGTHQFQTKNGSGTNSNTMIVKNTGIDYIRPINMIDDTPANRTINSSLFGLTDNSGNYASSPLFQLYQVGNTTYHQNLVNSGVQTFTVKDASGNNIQPLFINSSGSSFDRDVSISANRNLNMSAGSGIINQPTVVASTATNSLKKTNIVVDSGLATGSGTPALEIYDNVNAKGLYILPNSGSGSLGDTNRQNDCCLTSRASQNSNALTLSNWNSNLRNGLRIFTTDVSNCGISLQCGQASTGDWTAFNMDYTRTGGVNVTTTTFNNVINFNPGGNLAPARRQLIGLGTLNFTDISGNTTSGSRNTLMYMDSSMVVPGMVYDCSLNGGYHIFSANDNSGVKSTPIYFGAALTSVSNTLTIRNATTTSNRFDISTDGTQNTNIRARSTTASTSALININCDEVNSGGTTFNRAVLTIAPSYFEVKRPIQINYSTTPSTISQLGFSETTTANSNIPIGGVASSANIRNAHTYSITSAGTYLINWGISFVMNSGTATFTGGGLQFGIATSSINSFDSNTQTYTSYVNLTRLYPTLTTTTYYQPTSCTFRTTSSATIYFNYLAEYTGGTNIIPGGQYTITRIG